MLTKYPFLAVKIKIGELPLYAYQLTTLTCGTRPIVLKNSFFRCGQKISLKQTHWESRFIFVANTGQASHTERAGKTRRPLYSLNENPLRSLEFFQAGRKKSFSTQSTHSCPSHIDINRHKLSLVLCSISTIQATPPVNG
jgi:hypothetical protein